MTPRTGIRKGLAAVAWVTFANYVVSLLAIARGILFAGTLGPAGYGSWSLISSTQVLSQFGDGGVSQHAVREMPRAVGRGEPGTAAAHARASLQVGVLTSAILGTALAVGWGATGWPHIGLRWLLFPAVFAALNAFAIGGQAGRAFLSFRRVSAISVIAGTAGLVFGWAAAGRWGVQGLLLSQAVVYAAAAAALLVPIIGVRGILAVDPAVIRAAITTGWTLLLPGVSLQLLVSLDVYMAGVLLGAGEAGIYSVALLASTMAAGVLAQSASSVVGQYVLRRSGEDAVGPGEPLVWGSASGLALVLAPACAVAALAGPPLVRLLLPAYARSVLPMEVLLVGAYFLHSQFGFSTTLVARGRQLAVVPLYMGLAAANIVLDLVLVRAGFGILGIAIGTLAANIAFSISHMALVLFTAEARSSRAYAQVPLVLLAGALPAGAALYASGAAASWVPAAVCVIIAVTGAGAVAGLGLLSRSWAGDLAVEQARDAA